MYNSWLHDIWFTYIIQTIPTSTVITNIKIIYQGNGKFNDFVRETLNVNYYY
jgi:hypothetical protein